MKITCISDTHNKQQYIDTREFSTTDILIHAGDFTGNGNAAQTLAFLQWYSDLSVPHKILVAGNHDFSACSETFPSMLAQFPSITYLRNSSVTIDGLVIWGSPFSNIFGRWAFMADDIELADIWEQIPKDTNIVITHGPAYGIGDLVDNDYEPGRDKHVGSQSLRLRLEKLKHLKLHVTGHIHSGYGTYFKEKYVTINGAQLDDDYQFINPPLSVVL